MSVRELWGGVQRWYGAHSGRDRRIIVGVLVAVVLSVVYVGLVEPLRDYRRAVAEEIEQGYEQLTNAARFVARAEAITAERDDLRRRLDQARQRLLPGGSGTLGAAALQERANALAAEKGITAQSTQVMREEAVDPFRKVTVRLTLSGELRPFAEFVAGLEYGPQRLTLPFVEVSRRGAVAGARGPRILTATVEVSGYIAEGEVGKGPEGEAPAAEGEGAGAPAEGAPAAGPGPGQAEGVEAGAAAGPEIEAGAAAPAAGEGQGAGPAAPPTTVAPAGNAPVPAPEVQRPPAAPGEGGGP